MDRNNTKEWLQLDGAVEKRKVCKVPENTMEHMSTDALVDTVLNYPLLIDIYAYDTIEVGIKRISSYFQGIDILEKRSNARNVLLKYIKKAKAQDDDIKLIYAKTIYNYLSKKQGGFSIR